ncbi:MAG: glycerate kinase [Verrucomicrobia bacterium]|nr:glycerate kinase [Verrucomicrobiota bacterium]
MRYLVAPDKFKGTLSAQEVGRIVAEVAREQDGGAVVDILPIADGGEGTAALLAMQLGAQPRSMDTVDALERPISAQYFISGTEAFLDMSAASGLWQIAKDERQPLRSNTYGTGVIIRKLIEEGLAPISIGLGGSATVDAGIGIAAAMGYKFRDAAGRLLEPFPVHFADFARIERSSFAKHAQIVGLADVETKLLGQTGAIYTFGPQKGLSPEQVESLDRDLAKFVDLVERELGVNHAAVPRSGAAGGLGYGLMSFLDGHLVSGFAVVAERLKLEERIAAADIVITGEGKLDSQSLQGKGPFGVAAAAKAAGKPVWAIAGTVESHPGMESYFDRTIALVDDKITLEVAMAKPEETLRTRAADFWV